MFSIGALLVAFICHSQVFGIEDTAVQATATCSSQPIAQVTPTCTSETIAQEFSDIFFNNIKSAHDPNSIFGQWFNSKYSADKIYEVDLRIFLKKGFSNAEELASICSKAVSSGIGFTIPSYFRSVGTTLGEVLTEYGLLSCENVKQAATNFFECEKKVFQTLDPSKLESYEEALVTAMEDSLGVLDNEFIWETIVNKFSVTYLLPPLPGCY